MALSASKENLLLDRFERIRKRIEISTAGCELRGDIGIDLRHFGADGLKAGEISRRFYIDL